MTEEQWLFRVVIYVNELLLVGKVGFDSGTVGAVPVMWNDF